MRDLSKNMIVPFIIYFYFISQVTGCAFIAQSPLADGEALQFLGLYRRPISQAAE